jgi:ABC-type Fe3+/spermidine/putrescine transport system ATPase subunit
MYEHPQTAFVADFIGSLNALELTVDEVVGGFAVARAGESDRVVVPVDASVRAGQAIRVAVRPERVHVAVDASVPGDGSHLDGTVAQIVYLGMYTQFHVDTTAGRLVSNRLADEQLAPLEVGSPVTLSWGPEHSSVLAEPVVSA